ncbi:MAG: hypothetical protein PF505_05935 [Vallitaleaceae bacterium]|jgi:hypothetical protein|nr:hypothetical protein [Vallitaleaceae bacterium]
MSNIGHIPAVPVEYNQKTKTIATESNSSSNATSQIANGDTQKESPNISPKESPVAIYEPSEDAAAPEVKYKVDLDKVNAMKEETDRRMIELFKNTIDTGFLKQAGGLRGVLEKLINGEKVDGLDLDIEVTEESIQKAKDDVAPGGYWSPEETSTRFMDFAKALSGGDKSKADLLIDAFKEGYAMAQEIWGGELPEISQKTYDMTLEKFEAWKNED